MAPGGLSDHSPGPAPLVCRRKSRFSSFDAGRTRVPGSVPRQAPAHAVIEVADGRVKTSGWPGYATRQAHG